MTADLHRRHDGADAPAYDPMRLTSAVIAHLLRSGVPVSVRSASRAFEAAGRLLEQLGVEPADAAQVSRDVKADISGHGEVVPFQRRAARS